MKAPFLYIKLEKLCFFDCKSGGLSYAFMKKQSIFFAENFHKMNAIFSVKYKNKFAKKWLVFKRVKFYKKSKKTQFLLKK